MSTKVSDEPGVGAAEAKPQQRMVRWSVQVVGGPIGFGVGVIVVWELASVWGWINPDALPPPSRILRAWLSFLGQSFYWEAVRSTLVEVLLGFAIGVGIGLVLGLVLASVDLARRALLPLVVAYQNMPTVALAPLILAWLGLGLSSKVVLAAGISFFPLVVNVISAVDSIDRDSQSYLRSLGTGNVQMIRYLYVPGGLSGAMAGLRIAAGQSVIGVIVAEFVAGDTGVGSLITQYTSQVRVVEVFALVATLGVIGMCIYGVAALLERRALSWSRGGQQKDD